ncbi:MAG TPA: glycosyltransferase family 39 protein, partial [Vicinamibacteria bacterium]|nr:glycosyltransferase family 39 protein [Vicinamibacteria bacterium]
VWGADVLPSPGVAFSPFAYRLIFHPPLYPYFIGIVSTFLGGLTAVKVVQVVVGAMLVPVLGLLGRRVFGPCAGLLAALFAAVYPELVWFSVHFWVEGVFVVLLWWSFERLFAADERGSWPLAAWAGVLFGLSILARETALYFLPLAALWLWWRRPKGAQRAGALLVAAFLVIAPWTLRNYRVYQAFVPVSTAGALNLWQGNTRLSRQEVYDQSAAVHGRIEKYRFARRKAIEAIVERQPLWLFEKLRDEMPMFWEADGQPLVHIRRGAYGEATPLAALLASVVVLAPYLATLVLFVLALFVVPLTRASGLLLAFLGYYNLLHVATHGYARYRLPVLPVLFLIAAAGLAFWRARPRAAVTPVRKATATAVALALVLSLLPSLRLLVHHRALGYPDPGDRVSEEAEEP